MHNCCERMKHKERSTEEIKDLTIRLNRIEGQIGGIKKMLDENRYCPDILVQVSAVQSALNSFSKALLSSHIRSCVVDDIRSGNDDVVDELCELLKRMMK